MKAIMVMVIAGALGVLMTTNQANADTSGPPLLTQISATTRPNIVVVISDDQPLETMDAMPVVRSQIKNQGVQFNTGIIPTALCCPSRSSFLTGNYAHTTGVYTNSVSTGQAWLAFYNNGSGPEQNTLATNLQAAGYRTGLFGKYMNGFNEKAPTGYIPPGWDRFTFVSPDDGGDGTYYNYHLRGTEPTEAYGSTAADYSTDVTAAKTAEFIASTPADQPFFAYWAPTGPHSPMIPADRHKNTWTTMENVGGFNEANVSDKPAWVQDNPLLDATDYQNKLAHIHETLMSVDDGVQTIINAVGDRMDNTLFIYFSDNGNMLGAHRITGKDVPYKFGTEVPMFARWDGVIAPDSNVRRTTPQIDLTAAIVEATGISMNTDGKSFLSKNRAGTVVEQTAYNEHPAYCGWRTPQYLYVEYTQGQGQELYDYSVDPNELHNKVDDPAYASVVTDLRQKAVNNCTPVPEGFSWD